MLIYTHMQVKEGVLCLVIIFRARICWKTCCFPSSYH